MASTAHCRGFGQANIRREEGRGRGSGTQKFVHQKWHDQIFPSVNFVFFHYGHFGLGGGAPGGGGVLLWLSAVLM